MKTKKLITQFSFVHRHRFLLGLLAVLLAATPSLALDQTFEWLDQFGTTSPDYGFDVTANGGNIFVAGTTSGNLGGINAGVNDAYLRKYNATGGVVWTTQIGTSSLESCFDVATDSMGNGYIAGHTEGQFPGETSHLGIDAFVSKVDAAGNPVWTRQLGGDGPDQSNGVAVDSVGNVYMTGKTSSNLGGTAQGFDAFLTKYDSTGVLQWTKQIGTGGTDSSEEVVIDSADNVYITGFTTSNLGGTSAGGVDAYVIKFDNAGTVQWSSQIGGVYDEFGYDLTLDGLGNVYISGQTNYQFAGTTTSGGRDGFVGKFDASTGTLQWISQFGGSSSDMAYSVSADDLGNLLVAGTTWGAVEGSSFGDYDAFLGKLDPTTGNVEWLDQFGTSAKDEAYGVATDGWGNAYFTGYTYGTIGESRIGGYDAYLGKISTIPEPSTMLLLSLGLATLALARRR